MSIITSSSVRQGSEESQILFSLSTLEKSIEINREKVKALQNKLSFVSISVDRKPSEDINAEIVRPAMSELATRLWSFNSSVCAINKKLDEILQYLDL
jgi:hypothetical protein